MVMLMEDMHRTDIYPMIQVFQINIVILIMNIMLIMVVMLNMALQILVTVVVGIRIISILDTVFSFLIEVAAATA